GALQPQAAAGLPPRLGRFEVREGIGSGGMGVVLLAIDPADADRRVAIKLLRPQLRHDGRALALFHNEARHTAGLAHPHILKVAEVGGRDGWPAYVMPYLERGPLSRLMGPRLPLDEATALRFARQVAAALAYAHGRGLIHRDIKPGNILI